MHIYFSGYIISCRSCWETSKLQWPRCPPTPWSTSKFWWAERGVWLCSVRSAYNPHHLLELRGGYYFQGIRKCFREVEIILGDETKRKREIHPLMPAHNLRPMILKINNLLAQFMYCIFITKLNFSTLLSLNSPAFFSSPLFFSSPGWSRVAASPLLCTSFPMATTSIWL